MSENAISTIDAMIMFPVPGGFRMPTTTPVATVMERLATVSSPRRISRRVPTPSVLDASTDASRPKPSDALDRDRVELVVSPEAGGTA